MTVSAVFGRYTHKQLHQATFWCGMLRQVSLKLKVLHQIHIINDMTQKLNDTLIEERALSKLW
jgi:hypothetical protein